MHRHISRRVPNVPSLLLVINNTIYIILYTVFSLLVFGPLCRRIGAIVAARRYRIVPLSGVCVVAVCFGLLIRTVTHCDEAPQPRDYAIAVVKNPARISDTYSAEMVIVYTAV